MKIKEFDKFSEDCLRKFCNRKNRKEFITKKCVTINKQKNCYKKYIKKIESFEFNIDEEYIKFREQVWLNDAGFYDEKFKRRDWMNICNIWRVLEDKTKKYLIENIFIDEIVNDICRNIDVTHIYPKSTHKHLKYDIENGVLISRYFHNRLDKLQHPIYDRKITKNERLLWLKLAKNKK